MSDPRAWRGQPYLDELRPTPGWSVDLALFATYSLDLSALGAALLALCGRNDDAGGGSVADFAEAIETLRGKARFIVQRGRIARPARLPTLAGVLDRFVVEAPYDEERRSWHPKAALVRYVRDKPDGNSRGRKLQESWRLWIGSRNLTRSSDLDAGLLLETPTGGRRKGRPIEGAGRVAGLLAERAGLDAKAAGEIAEATAQASWLAPDGVEVARIDAADDGSPMPPMSADARVDRVTVVSPFLDARFLRRVGAWGGRDTERTLVSTRQALVAIAQGRDPPIGRFDRLLALDAPDPPLDGEPDTVGPSPPAGQNADDADPAPPSLHAKLFCLERGDHATLRMGSANATSRAWDGRNAEMLAELRGGPALVEGLRHLFGSATPVTLEELEQAAPTAATARDELELARRRLVGAWSPRLTREDARFAVEVGTTPALPTGVVLSVGLAATDLVAWPPGATRIALGDIPLARQTDLIRCELRVGNAAVGWMQRAPVEPPLADDRDAAALAQMMGFGAFQGWMRQMLLGDGARQEGTPWDRPGANDGSATSPNVGPDNEPLTLEDIVGSWGADRRRFLNADAHFDRYCDALTRQEAIPATNRAALDELRAIWRLARERLTR